MKKPYYFLLLPAIAAAFTCTQLSCSQEDVPRETGSLSVRFDNKVGDKDLVLNTETYTNAAGEDFTVGKLNYFISNIRLLKDNERSYVIPQDSSYFLILEKDPASQTITLNNIPAGSYSGIEYIIGVDSLRSVSDESKRKGVLDKNSGPTNSEAMYWDWNPGYIFLKMEGTSDVAATPKGEFYYHIGGFGGFKERTLNNIRTVKLSFGPENAVVRSGAKSHISIKADILKIFDGPTPLSISKNPGVMYAPFSANIAANYANMFSVTEVRED